MNPLVGLYGFPRGEDLSEYKNNFEVFDPARNMNVQNWYTSYQDMEQNPYWITNRINSNDKRTRAIASLTANVKITDWLNIQHAVQPTTHTTSINSACMPLPLLP